MDCNSPVLEGFLPFTDRWKFEKGDPARLNQSLQNWGKSKNSYIKKEVKVTDLFDSFDGDKTPSVPATEPGAVEPAGDEDGQVLAEEEAGEEGEGGTAEGEESDTEGKDGGETEEEASATPTDNTNPSTTPVPAAQKQVNVVEEDPYEFDKCLITIAMAWMPDDGNPDGRMVMLGVRNHQDEPILVTVRLSDLMPLPDPIQQLIDRLKEQLPARSAKAAEKKAKTKEEEEKRKAARSKSTGKSNKAAAPKKAEKPKPTTMNLFDMFEK